MASMTIRNLDDQLRAKLRLRAALHRRSMEDEARDILRTALSIEPARTTSLVESIRARIAPLSGVDLEVPPREPIRDPQRVDE